MAEGFLSADEQALLSERVRANQPAAEEELARLFQPRLMALLVSRTRDPEAAREVSAQALIEVILALRTGAVPGTDQLAVFIQATGRNLANKYLRSLATLRARDEILSTESMDRIAEMMSPLDAEAAHRQTLVSEAVETLDPEERTILAMALVEGRTAWDIAERLALTAEVVRERKSQAVTKTRVASK